MIKVYIIYKNTDYQDLGNKRIDVGLYYVGEKNFDAPKECMLFGAKRCERFIEEDVFFNDKVGAYIECAKRNKQIIDSFLNDRKIYDEKWHEKMLNGREKK